jgi:ABC-type enterobactin transport system permease subunit
MKNLVISLCVCFSLAVLPCAAQGADHPRVAKVGAIITSAFLVGTVGALVGAIISAGAQSTSGSPVVAGMVAGACVGALIAIMSPDTAEAVQGSAQTGSPPPPAAPAAAPN